MRKQPIAAQSEEVPVVEPPAEENLAEVQETAAPVVEEIPAVTEVEAQPEEIAPPVEEPIAAKAEEKKETPPATGAKVFRPAAGAQVTRKLTLTKAALNSGLKQGERIVAPPPVTQKIENKPADRGRDRGGNTTGRRDFQNNNRGGGAASPFRGTPGESAKPQTVYIPPADSRKKLGRSAGKKGADRRNDQRGGGRFNEREVVRRVRFRFRKRSLISSETSMLIILNRRV